MIEILTPDDVSKIKDCYIAEYIKNLLTNLLTQTSDCSLETVGGIFYVENEKDFDNYKKFGLSSKITESRFEWIDLIGNDFLDGCIVLDNDRAINIVGKADYFKKGVLNYEYSEHNRNKQHSKNNSGLFQKQKRPLFVESRMGQQQKVACNNNDLSLICR